MAGCRPRRLYGASRPGRRGRLCLASFIRPGLDPGQGNVPGPQLSHWLHRNEPRDRAGVPAAGPAGPAHPDPVLEQVFNVRSSDKASYLLGWDIVPYRGIGTYRFGTDGDVLALEPPAGGRPVGYGTGTITFIGRSSSGTVRALVKLKAGGALDIRGTWVCPATAG